MCAFQVVTGPLTNIAIALEMDPRFASWPAQMIIMGGNWQGSFSRPRIISLISRPRCRKRRAHHGGIELRDGPRGGVHRPEGDEVQHHPGDLGIGAVRSGPGETQTPLTKAMDPATSAFDHKMRSIQV